MRRCFIKTNYEKYLKSDYGLKEGTVLNVSYEDFSPCGIVFGKERRRNFTFFFKFSGY